MAGLDDLRGLFQPMILWFYILDGRSLKMLASYGSKEVNSMTEKSWVSNHLTGANPIFLLTLCCQFLLVFICACVFLRTSVCMFFCMLMFLQDNAFSCSFCLSAIANVEPSRDCSFHPSLIIPLFCIHKTFPTGQFYINKYLSSH